MHEAIAEIHKTKIVAIIRVKDSSTIGLIAKCLVEAGITALEITSNTPDYLDSITQLQTKYPSIFIGAGTITNDKLAKDAISAGAHFLVTPNTSRQVLDVAKSTQTPILVGALTPTEIYQAYEWGADLIKVFPTNSVTYDYITSLTSGPFNDIPLVAVGSVDENNAKKWIESGAVCVGFGGELTSPILSAEEYITRKSRIISLIKSIS
ncbi:2-keto-3-deoxy-phosphogluconate aldolase [Alteromonas sp. KUL17]|uniref:bifunctional 4-hydroxy-2-oxoglutarate aldolase/2-dehydro-3-deoxy-phosphogluconate aldolase n=1 Tax=Alteromonas sp. KUL17 TaxID=2480796 RepID=UPI0010373D08|nr:bifunctional 4-hydroxy-2-oxoglutarate aldolase/2-dehydro-3-deoxy-phosphogluconate aldolase [Alteromonas sp. KUL17]TAP30595.1 bifunctional 4-hydroxy-2-oxoglutarate aldolase/2-dehydro-3-deoxy-phosphogluconate aldolase [Alteromonas sp. KUL17]GEA01586.1 2-keto-3-deoxy-phosphogluconate aldolase [Alteromonas sp. KUL17]